MCHLLKPMLSVKVASLSDAGLLLLTTFSCHLVDLEFYWKYLFVIPHTEPSKQYLYCNSPYHPV